MPYLFQARKGNTGPLGGTDHLCHVVDGLAIYYATRVPLGRPRIQQSIPSGFRLWLHSTADIIFDWSWELFRCKTGLVLCRLPYAPERQFTGGGGGLAAAFIFRVHELEAHSGPIRNLAPLPRWESTSISPSPVRTRRPHNPLAVPLVSPSTNFTRLHRWFPGDPLHPRIDRAAPAGEHGRGGRMGCCRQREDHIQRTQKQHDWAQMFPEGR